MVANEILLIRNEIDFWWHKQIFGDRTLFNHLLYKYGSQAEQCLSIVRLHTEISKSCKSWLVELNALLQLKSLYDISSYSEFLYFASAPLKKETLDDCLNLLRISAYRGTKSAPSRTSRRRKAQRDAKFKQERHFSFTNDFLRVLGSRFYRKFLYHLITNK